MMVRNDRIAERGTLLVEAIAMLGLIALVTPTLYKKSAERLQEIQDINIASQARTMNSIIDTFMKTNYSLLMQETSSASNNTVEIAYDDNTANYFELGYSSFVPFGYTPGDLKNYGTPRIYVHRDKDALVSYIVYPTLQDLGKKRAARVASLVGANGGTVSTPFGGSSTVEIFGTGGAWHLDHSMIEEMAFDNDAITENSLVVTSNEPVTMSSMDSEKFLYRVPGEDHDYHNTMVTDLYMGGHQEETKWSGNADDYYSIFNLRKLTLNTRCTRAMAQSGGGAGGSSSAGSTDVENLCDPNVADLYIGKPFTYDNKGTRDAMLAGHNAMVDQGNRGAAWIYGNLSVLNENFRLFRENASGSEVLDLDRDPENYDVIEFARRNGSSTALSIFRAENPNGSSRVTLMDDFVQARQASGADADSGSFEFLVGASSSVRGEGSFIHALTEGDNNVLRLNSPTDLGGADETTPPFETYINSKGGIVHINGGASSNVKMETIINDMGGVLTAGKSGDWLIASGNDNSSEVHLLRAHDFAAAGSGGDGRVFTVGKDKENDDANMIYGNTYRTSLRGGQLRIYNPTATSRLNNHGFDTTKLGGEMLWTEIKSSSRVGAETEPELEGATILSSRYTDIWGSTYMGKGEMLSTENGDGVYARSSYVLGVAGSAWVDRLLWAREAWFKKAGLQELHAGFENFADYLHNSSAAWLNAYKDSVVIRNRAKAKDKPFTTQDSSSDTMFYADSSRVTIRDLEGASIELTDNTAYMGNNNKDNFFYAASASTGGYSSAVYMVGSSLAHIYTKNAGNEGVVNLQKDALKVKGQPGEGDSYPNKIEAKAGEFSIQTQGAEDGSANVQFFANDTDIRTRYVDFSVENDKSSAIFKVMPNGENHGSADANVQVHGTFHVEGNRVMHVASNLENRADSENGHDVHAMLEVDPEYIQVWGRGQNSYSSFGDYAKNGDYFAMLKINPSDISGSASAAGVTDDASIYVRRGAIEFEPSVSSTADAYAADEGFGYIKANRLVSNAGKVIPSEIRLSAEATHGTGEGGYDQYMVNPAYTSVMHDIKLTTRGGARLSDVLPDYILKGVYNLINNRVEGSPNTPNDDMKSWADPYIGIVPYAPCPPGYYNQGTVIPISFNMGQAGTLIRAKDIQGMNPNNRGGWVVNPFPRQAEMISEAGNNLDIVYPKLKEVKHTTYQEVTGDHDTFEKREIEKTQGWFFGLDAVYHGTGVDAELKSGANTEDGGTGAYDNYKAWRYTEDGGYSTKAGPDWDVVAESLYFQQNTWLKTSIIPGEKGWNAYMGFLYDTSVWKNGWGVAGSNDNIKSNYNEQGHTNTNDPDRPDYSGYAWNFFPVPTNTLEGHATVYCYFDRTNFKNNGWENLVDQIDQLGAIESGSNYRTPGNYDEGEGGKPSDYVKRLNDPTLKYTDPW